MDEIDKDINKPFGKSTCLIWKNFKAVKNQVVNFDLNTAEKLKIRSLERERKRPSSSNVTLPYLDFLWKSKVVKNKSKSVIYYNILPTILRYYGIIKNTILSNYNVTASGYYRSIFYYNTLQYISTFTLLLKFRKIWSGYYV